MRVLSISTTLAMTWACGSTPTPPVLANLPHNSGHTDVSFVACTDADAPTTSKIVAFYPGLLEQALAAGETVVTEVAVDDPDLLLKIESDVTLIGGCDDDGSADVTHFEPVSGTVTFTITPYGPDELDVAGCKWGRGSASLDGITVEIDGERLAMEPGVIEGSDLPKLAQDTGDCLGNFPGQ
jgi:hypothetical protein